MTPQPKSGPGLPFLGLRNNNLFTGLDCYSSAQPPTWRTRSPYLWPPETRWPSYTQTLGTHFSRLLRHAWVTVGLFFNPGHHTGPKDVWKHQIFSEFNKSKIIPFTYIYLLQIFRMR
jgi:hypothetical protein